MINKIRFYNNYGKVFLPVVLFFFIFAFSISLSAKTSPQSGEACAGDGKVECTTTTTKAYPVDSNGIPDMPLYKQGGGNPWSGASFGCGGTTVASSGCGPTSLAMVLSYFKKTNIYPDKIASDCLALGPGVCRVCNSGSSAAGLAKVATQYDMYVSLNIGWSTVISLLEQKKPVIITVGGPSIFTNGGHYIVLKGKIGNNIYINDSSRNNTIVDASTVRSAYNIGSQSSLYVRPWDYK